MRGGPFEFRYLYIHDNYGADNQNNAGLKLENGVCNTTIEFCRFQANGQIKDDLSDTSPRTTSVANLLIQSDYKYEDEISLYNPDTGYCTATFNNNIRYNLFEADSDFYNESYYTSVGFKHKAMQRLTGYEYADQENPSDIFPNDDRWEHLGDDIHHNVFINHTIATEIDQDYAQVYKNIMDMKNRPGPQNAIQGRDGSSGRRGPFKFTIYNNLIKSDGLPGIVHHPIQNGWSGDTPYTKCYVHNNIIKNSESYGGYGDISISPSDDHITTNNGYSLEDISVDNNYFYDYSGLDFVYIYNKTYNENEIEATPSAENVYSNLYDSQNSLFKGNSGADKYKTYASHEIEPGITIANGGRGGEHPYLEGFEIPDYVGAVNPEDDAWVDGVLGLADVDYLKNSPSGDPEWIEDYNSSLEQICGDNVCNGTEDCSSCPEDCLNLETEVCCSGTAYTGDCCDDRDCSQDFVCNLSSHLCFENPTQQQECVHDAEIEPCDGTVSFSEIENYLDRWLNGEITIDQLLSGINEWRGL